MQSADLKTDAELVLFKSPFFQTGANIQSPFEDQIDGGFDMDNYGGDGRSILYLFLQHECLSLDMYYISYFITRGFQTSCRTPTWGLGLIPT